jgi:YgiT-type zinc finger domain-containing protein
MSRVYHSCHFCGGSVREKRIVIDYRWGEELVAIIENVPAGVCDVCGEQYLKAEIVKEMEKAARSPVRPARVLQVPLRELTTV